MKKCKKQPIGGKKITRKQALEGLGNPAEWEAYKERMYEEFRRTPESYRKDGDAGCGGEV
jgi:hypothetical protein